jgi:hypothetical protein
LDARAGKTTPRLIAMAVSLCGDKDIVSKAMCCSDSDLLAYCAGEKEPPWPELDRLIGLIIREQGVLIAGNREHLNKLRRKDGT